MFISLTFISLPRRSNDYEILCRTFKNIFSDSIYPTVIDIFDSYLFKYELHVLERITNNIPLANNSSEGSNSALNKEFVNGKPTLEVLLVKLINIDQYTSYKIEDHNLSYFSQEKSQNVPITKTADIYRRIKNILSHQESLSELDLLKALASCYNWVLND